MIRIPLLLIVVLVAGVLTVWLYKWLINSPRFAANVDALAPDDDLAAAGKIAAAKSAGRKAVKSLAAREASARQAARSVLRSLKS